MNEKEVITGPEAFRAKLLGTEAFRIRLITDGQEISLEACPELIAQAALLLNHQVELEAVLTRSAQPPQYPILEGQATRIEALIEQGPVEAWDAWYASAGTPWANIKEIETELRNDG